MLRRGPQLLAARPWAVAAALFLACMAIYVPAVSRIAVNTDVAANSLTAWHIAHTGQPWMDRLDLREDGKVSHYGRSPNGHMVTTRTPGQIWLAVPFYLGTSDDQQEWTFARGGIAAATMTAAAVALLYLALRRGGANATLALLSAAVFGFTTPIWSVSADALWTHPVTVLGICGASWALAHQRWWVAGAWFGVGILARPHIAIIAAVVGLALGWASRSPRPVVRVGVPSGLAMALLAVWNRYVFGSWDPRGAYIGHDVENVVPGMNKGPMAYVENLAGFLVSPDRGLLVWTPLLLLLIPAVVRGWSSAPTWSRALALGGLIYTIAQLGLNVFHGGDAFYGYRHGLELLAALTPLFAFCARHVGSAARALVPAVVGLQFAAIALGAMFMMLSLPESRVWQDNAAVNAVVNFPTSLGLAFAALALGGALTTRQVIASQRCQGSLAGDRQGKASAV